MAMGKREDFLKWLESQVGVTEDPPGSNNVPYNTAYYGFPVNGADYHWCVTFQWDGLTIIGCAELFYGGRKTNYAPTLLDFYRQQGQIVTDPQPGDLAFYDWDKSGKPDHVGAVVGVTASTITTIEGNVGDAVKRLIRQRDGKIQAFVRLRWPDEQEAEPEPEPEPELEIVEPFKDVKKHDWFAAAVAWAYRKGIVKGITTVLFGPNNGTTRAQTVQMLFKLDKLNEKRFKAVEQKVADL